MESSSEITDLKKLLSDLKVALESRHMNNQDMQFRIRKMTEMLESGYLKDEETLHQQRREATRTIEEAKREAAEDRDAAKAERDAARAEAELKIKDADAWRKRTMEEIEIHSEKRHEETAEQILRHWQPKETEHRASVAQLMKDQAQFIHEKELLESNEARHRADIIRLTADQNKVNQDKALLDSRVNQCLDILTAAQATKTWVMAKYAVLLGTLHLVEVEKSRAREMLQQADVVISKAKEIRSQVSEKLGVGKKECNEVGEQLRSQEARLQSQRSNMSDLKAEMSVREGEVMEILQGFEDSVTDTHKNLTNVLCKVDDFDEDLTVLLSKVDVVKKALADLSGKVDEVEIAPLDSSINKLADSVAKIHADTNNASKSASALQKTTIGMQASASSVESEVEQKCAAALEKVSEVNEAIAEAGASLKGLLDQFEQAKENVRKSPEEDRRRKMPRLAGTPDRSPSSSFHFTLSPSPPLEPAGSSSITAPAGLDPPGLAAASEEIKDIWRQIQFPSNWTSADSAALLDSFTKAKARSGGSNHRYWPQQAMDNRSAKRTMEGLGKPFCLDRDLHRAKPTFEDPDEERYPCVACTKSRSVCVDVSFVRSDPGPYLWNGTEKRWNLVKQQ